MFLEENLTRRRIYDCGARFIEELANVTFLQGVREKASKNGTSSQTIDYFEQVAFCNSDEEHTFSAFCNVVAKHIFSAEPFFFVILW